MITSSDIQGGFYGSGNLNQDPNFADPGNGDFHLAEGSPRIDSGDPGAPSLPLTDFEGDPRDDHPDMGVDEFVKEDLVEGLDAYALYAKEKVRLRRIADSRGNVGSNGKIWIARGHSGTLEGNLCALEKIRVMGSITIDGDVLTNGDVGVHRRGRLDVTGTITEGEEAGLSPIELPEVNFTTGGKNIRVRRTQSLKPGSYGNVRVMKHATFRLSSGDYYLNRLDLRRRAALSIDLSGGARHDQHSEGTAHVSAHSNPH